MRFSADNGSENAQSSRRQLQPYPAARKSEGGAALLWTSALPMRVHSSTSSSGECHYFTAASAPMEESSTISPKKRKWSKAHQPRGSLLALHSGRAGVNGELFNTILGSELTAELLTSHASLATMLNGLTMNEWWSSLRACLGPKLSQLHTDILAFCKAQELTREQILVRRGAQDFLKSAVRDLWPDAEVHLFGSTATGLALPSSDIDIVVVMSPERYVYNSWRFCDTRPWVSELWKKLLKSLGMFRSVTPILNAKVPILKAIFRSGLTCDISFDSHDNTSRQGVQLVRRFLQQYAALRPLCLVLKVFLKQQNLNEVFTGGIGSFCLTIMITSHLQKLGADGAVYDLGALLVSFFERYTTRHDYVTDVVSTRPEKCATKQARGWVNIRDPERLAVENPLDPSSDVAVGAFNSHEVRAKFSQAKRALLDNWHEEKLLDFMFKTCGA